MLPSRFSASLKGCSLNPSACFLSFSLILYPATLVSIPKVNGLVFVLFTIQGLFILYRERFKGFNRDETLVFVVVAALFLSAMLSVVIGGGGHKVLQKYVHVLLFIPVYVYLKNTDIKQSFLWFGLVSGAVVAAAVASYDVFFLNERRAHGFMNVILFSNLSLVLGCMAMAGVGWYKQRSNWLVFVPIFALTCGVFVSVLASTRGSWVALPFLVILLYWYVKSYFSIKQKLMAAVVIITVSCALYLMPQTKVGIHIDRAFNSIQQYRDSETIFKARMASAAARIEMWHASWKIFLDNPIVGAGWGNYQVLAQIQVDQGLRNKKAAEFNHPHSEYFFALAGGGGLGIIVLMSLYLVPAWIFMKNIKRGSSPDIKRLALGGLVLIISFMAFGLTEPMLYRSRSVNFFTLYLAVFMAAIYGKKN